MIRPERSVAPKLAPPDRRRCPICDGIDADPIYTQRFARFAAGSISDGYDVVACSVCGMCFASGLPDENRFAEYYTTSSKYDLDNADARLAPAEVARFAGQADFVAGHVLDKSLRILDVGTAAGGFLRALRDAGYQDVFGVEPSPDAVRIARDVNGLDVRVGGLDSAGFWPHTFGLISYVAVLEHVLSPRDQIRAVGSLLDADGFMFVAVPDAGRFPEHAAAPFQEFSVEHINFFTRASLDNALAVEGFALVAARQIVLPLGTDAGGPAIEAIYRRDGRARAWSPDLEGVDRIREYVDASTRSEQQTIETISGVADSGQAIYVWGTGTHTLHLLEISRLSDCNIVAFIDSNPHYAGSELMGRPVVAPVAVARSDEPILVSSAVSQGGIAAAARAQFGPDIPLILLYP